MASKKRRTHSRNTHRSLVGGLSTDDGLLDQFVQMAAESAELSCYDEAEATPEVQAEAKRYDKALAEALSDLVEKYPPKNGATADDLWDAKGPYLVLMTLRGEGVGIWDGRWDEFYDDTKKVETFLEKRLGKFADDTGGGSLEEAFINAAFETCPCSCDNTCRGCSEGMTAAECPCEAERER